jgi:hypothetical protein
MLGGGGHSGASTLLAAAAYLANRYTLMGKSDAAGAFRLWFMAGPGLSCNVSASGAGLNGQLTLQQEAVEDIDLVLR